MSTKRILRSKRKARIRAKVRGTQERPRLVVFRSNSALSVQVIDDTRGVTVAAARTKGKNKEAAEHVGKAIAQAALARGITRVVFDRGGYRFHGTIAQLATAAKAGGLQF